VLAVDLPQVVQAVLFLLFADLTALISAVIGPTYDNLLVPEMSAHALYPAVFVSAPAPSDFLGRAAEFSAYLIAGVVDPVVALLALGIAVLYLARTTLPRWAPTFDGLLPRLVLSIAAANFTVPIAAGILSLSGALYPVVAGWDGGAWHHWVALGGYGEFELSWDNGLLAFVLSLVEFALVFSLILAIGLRDALLAVLLVALPLLTLLWPFRPLAALPRRAWLLFAELAFLPCVLVIPLELAVGSPSPVLLVGYLGAAVASPFLLSVAGSHLVAIGFPSGGTVAQASANRGLASAPGAATGLAAPALAAVRDSGAIGRAAGGAARSAATAGGPLAVPAALHELLGHGALSVARHIGERSGRGGGPPHFPPLRPEAVGGDGRP
jgi:hypothetical protein